jgi:hypothetical protein
MQEKRLLDKLLKQINGRSLDSTAKHQFIEIGRPAYEYLIEQIDNHQLTDYQVINALAIAVEMRYFGEPTQVIDKILDLVQDSRIRVRSWASHLAISLLRQSEQCQTPAFHLGREMLKPLIKTAISMKLEPNTMSYAQDFLQGKI